MVRAELFGHVYHTPAWPAGVAGFGLLLCVAAAGLLFLDRAKRPKIAWPALLVAPLAALLLLVLGLIPVLTGSAIGDGLYAADFLVGPRPWRAFGPLLGAEVGAWCAAVGVLLLAAWARTLLSLRWHLSALPIPAAPAALGLLLAAVGPAHATWFTARGPLPMLEADLPPWLHVGHEVVVTPTVTGCSHPGDCQAEVSTLRPEQAGTLQVPLRARCPLLLAETQAEILVGEDRGDPGFPLAVGNRWSWQHVREWRNQVLWFFPDRGREEGPLLHLEVVGQDASGPLTTWRLREQIEGQEPTEHEIYRWDGSLRWLSDEGAPTDAIFFATRDASEGEAHDPEGHTLVGCDFSLFSESACRCLPQAEGAAHLPGPSVCSRAPSAGDDLRTLGSVFLAIITAGLVVVDPDDDPRWVLLSSSRAETP
ncbi:MAG: hypothetical protein ABIO70_26815 [Pseudomonadota bacterium]